MVFLLKNLPNMSGLIYFAWTFSFFENSCLAIPQNALTRTATFTISFKHTIMNLLLYYHNSMKWRTKFPNFEKIWWDQKYLLDSSHGFSTIWSCVIIWIRLNISKKEAHKENEALIHWGLNYYLQSNRGIDETYQNLLYILLHHWLTYQEWYWRLRISARVAMLLGFTTPHHFRFPVVTFHQ